MIVEQLNRIMTKHNLTQLELAEYLGVPLSTVIKWLRGSRKPHVTLYRLIDVLGIMEIFTPDIHSTLLPKGKKND